MVLMGEKTHSGHFLLLLFSVCFHWIFVIDMCLQESTVIMCAHKASGDPTVQSAAPVRMEDPALLRTAHVCVHLDTEGPPAKEVSSFLVLSVTSFPKNISEAWAQASDAARVLTLLWSLKMCWRAEEAEETTCVSVVTARVETLHHGYHLIMQSLLTQTHTQTLPRQTLSYCHTNTYTGHPSTPSSTTNSQWEIRSPRPRLIRGCSHWEC